MDDESPMEPDNVAGEASGDVAPADTPNGQPPLGASQGHPVRTWQQVGATKPGFERRPDHAHPHRIVAWLGGVLVHGDEQTESLPAGEGAGGRRRPRDTQDLMNDQDARSRLEQLALYASQLQAGPQGNESKTASDSQSGSGPNRTQSDAAVAGTAAVCRRPQKAPLAAPPHRIWHRRRSRRRRGRGRRRRTAPEASRGPRLWPPPCCRRVRSDRWRASCPRRPPGNASLDAALGSGGEPVGAGERAAGCRSAQTLRGMAAGRLDPSGRRRARVRGLGSATGPRDSGRFRRHGGGALATFTPVGEARRTRSFGRHSRDRPRDRPLSWAVSSRRPTISWPYPRGSGRDGGVPSTLRNWPASSSAQTTPY